VPPPTDFSQSTSTKTLKILLFLFTVPGYEAEPEFSLVSELPPATKRCFVAHSVLIGASSARNVSLRTKKSFEMEVVVSIPKVIFSGRRFSFARGSLSSPTRAPQRSDDVDRSELRERRRGYLLAVLRAAKLRSMAALAKKLNVAQSTLTNIQSASRSASPELIGKIRLLAPGLEGSGILSAEAELSPGAPVNLVESDTRLHLGERLAQDYNERIQKLQGVEDAPDKDVRETARNFDAMDRGDVFIYLSAIMRPLEMDPEEILLKKSIAHAIQRHAFFLYVRPTKAYLKTVGNFVDIRAEFAGFREQVFNFISNDRTSFLKQLLLIQTDENPLFAAADFKWELFYSDRINAPYKAAAGALVASGVDPTHHGPRIRIPLSVTSTKRILFEIAKTICMVNPELQHSEQVPFDIVSRLKESAELATGQKVDTS
jgi:transcriptional regulator with XRE-family HTH domain